MTAAPKKRAPVRLTGNTGARYENEVAARFLLDMLTGTNSVGSEFGQVERMDWQTRDTGWILDDLLVSCRAIDGAKRAVGFSYKSNRQLTQNGFPADFVDLAWGQWLGVDGRALKKGVDAVALVSASAAVDVLDDWNALLREILHTTPDRIVARLQSTPGQGAQSSSIQRNILDGFTCPSRYTHTSAREEIVELLHDVRVLVYDFGTPTSRDSVKALLDCRSALTSSGAAEAAELWERLIGICDEMRPVGGALDLERLLDKLRGKFQLRDHPDYRADIEILRTRAAAAMDDIETRVARLAHLPRTDIASRVHEKFAANQSCVVTGDSGSGKSALLKELSEDYGLTIWLSREAMDHPTLVDLQTTLGLHYPIIETINRISGSCLIVLDGLEGCSERALKLCAALLNKVHEMGGSHIHTAASLQLDSVERVTRFLLSHNVPLSRLTAVQCERPSLDEVHKLLDSVPALQWLALRPELNPVLANLKVLDWFASGGPTSSPDAGRTLTATGVIDSLWARWTESSDDGPVRSLLLMDVARLEADTLSYGLARGTIDGAKQSTLRGLEQAGLIRVRNERVYLHHDLLGHWARLRLLISENPNVLVHLHQHALSPLWQPAIRLFGQRLLEGNEEGRQRWLSNVEIQAEASSAASVTRDLFIDALCLATDSNALLLKMWDALVAHEGKLLNLLLRRFLAVATVPDPRVAAFSSPDDAIKIEHLVRIPNWVYWPPVLAFLHSKRDEVAHIAPYAAADVCHLWLRTTSALQAQGIEIQWQKEAAELAYAIAREVQARNLETAYYSEGKDDPVFQAVLYGAPFLPDEVATLCLELAGRRATDSKITARVTRVKQERLEAQRAATKDKPRKQAMTPPVLGFRRKAAPWPDGPQTHVFSQFRTACLAGEPFMGLVKANATVAIEVLLAVCIEESPDEDDFGSSSMPESGMSYWHEGEPAAYFRGPFLSFLIAAPEEALTFILRLTNFATRRYTREQRWLDIAIAGEKKRWYGDASVYRWHHDWPAHNATQVMAALMALEFWLYAEIKQGRAVDRWLKRILVESESLAFAGILMNVGKLEPALFTNVLKPLFFVWHFWTWDFQLATLQATSSTGPGGYWGQQSRKLFELAADFYKLPHRSEALLYPQGPIARKLLGNASFAALFEEVRIDWQTHVVEDDEDDSLKLLIERIRPENYSFEMRGNEMVPVSFSWPEDIAKRNEASLQKIQEEQYLRGLPFQCRKFIHSAADLPQEQAEWLWKFLQSLDPRITELPKDRDDPNWEVVEACIAGIALLISKQLPWLQQDPSKIAWCRAKLEDTLSLSTTALYNEVSVGDQRWDSFAAESGIMLLVLDPQDCLARKLIASAVTAFRYETTKLVISRAAIVRAHLGDLFMQTVALAIRWAATRSLTRYQDKDDAVSARNSLIEQFEAGKISASIPDLSQLSSALQEELDQHHERKFPGWKENRARLKSREDGGRRRKVRAGHLALDERVMTAAFGWLDLKQAATTAELKAWSAMLQELQKLLLEHIPTTTPDSDDRLEGSPSEFDNWTLQTLARNIPRVVDRSAREALWKPILDRGALSHRWVEHFFWHWFTDGFDAAGSADRFVELWKPMIEHALSLPSWERRKVLSFDLDEVVVQLLALDARWTRRLTAVENASIFSQLRNHYERALAYWATTPRVVSHFVSFVLLPGPSTFMLPAIQWLLPHVEQFDTYDWKHGVEDGLIDFLGACWAQKREELSSDTNIREAFLKLLALVTARGSPAAIALSRRIAG